MICLTGTFLKVTITFIVLFKFQADAQEDPQNQCDYYLVESMPENLLYDRMLPFDVAETHRVFLNLIKTATKTIQLASFYISLTPTSPEHLNHPTATPGRLVLEALEEAARDRKIEVKLALGFIHDHFSNLDDLRRLQEAGVEVKHLDVTKLLGSGVQHAKFLISDNSSFYLGSANLDWRAFTHVKEVGIMFSDCNELARDLSKVFETYTMLADDPDMLNNIPDHLSTKWNLSNPLKLKMDGTPTSIFLSTSPHRFNGAKDRRTDDLDSIVDMISRARKFVHISVMKFRNFDGRSYWPTIENAIRAAVLERKVTVKLLIAKNGKQYEQELGFYNSLMAFRFANPRLGRVEVKYFKVPDDDPFHKSIPFSRVKHDKYVVTDNGAYIGTSNWEQGYFQNTCGVGISIRPDRIGHFSSGVVVNLAKIFDRDYFSDYAQSVI